MDTKTAEPKHPGDMTEQAEQIAKLGKSVPPERGTPGKYTSPEEAKKLQEEEEKKKK